MILRRSHSGKGSGDDRAAAEEAVRQDFKDMEEAAARYEALRTKFLGSRGSSAADQDALCSNSTGGHAILQGRQLRQRISKLGVEMPGRCAGPSAESKSSQ